MERRKKNNMNRKESLHYFKQKELASDTNIEKEITSTKTNTSATNHISNAELNLGDAKVCDAFYELSKRNPRKN